MKANMMQVISELNKINRKLTVQTFPNDAITIDKHGNTLYIYTRNNDLNDCIFELDAITKVLHSFGLSFYLSSTKYDKPTVVVQFR